MYLFARSAEASADRYEFSNTDNLFTPNACTYYIYHMVFEFGSIGPWTIKHRTNSPHAVFHIGNFFQGTTNMMCTAKLIKLFWMIFQISNHTCVYLAPKPGSASGSSKPMDHSRNLTSQSQLMCQYISTKAVSLIQESSFVSHLAHAVVVRLPATTAQLHIILFCSPCMSTNANDKEK